MSQKDDELLKLTSYVEISKYREKTLKSIGNNVKIPTNVPKEMQIIASFKFSTFSILSLRFILFVFYSSTVSCYKNCISHSTA